MIPAELSSTSHIWVVLSVKIAREGRKERASGERAEKICPSPQPSKYFLELLFKTLLDLSFCGHANLKVLGQEVWPG
jgi:hypothetical protein